MRAPTCRQVHGVYDLLIEITVLQCREYLLIVGDAVLGDLLRSAGLHSMSRVDVMRSPLRWILRRDEWDDRIMRAEGKSSLDIVHSSSLLRVDKVLS